MGKEIDRFYEHSQLNWPYTLPNTKFVVPPSYVLSPRIDINNNGSGAIISYNQPSLVSNLTNTNKFNNDVNNDDDTQYFSAPIKHNHSTH